MGIGGRSFCQCDQALEHTQNWVGQMARSLGQWHLLYRGEGMAGGEPSGLLVNLPRLTLISELSFQGPPSG